MKNVNLKTKLTSMLLAALLIAGLIPCMVLNASAATLPLWPTQGYGVLDEWDNYFGNRIHPITGEYKFHYGVDIAAPTGTPVYAAADGEIVFAGDDGGYGLSVKLKSDTGYFKGYTRYSHCSSLNVSYGQKVQRGDILAYVGSTGNSTGPHLHFGMWDLYDYNHDIDPLSITYGYDYDKTGNIETSGTNPYPVPQRNLSWGDSGEDVKYVQWGLNKLGFNCGAVDGIFGAATDGALIGFQSRHGLEADGIFGQQSLKKMRELINPSSAPSPSAQYNTGTYKPRDTDGLNVRSSPDVNSSRVGGIDYGNSFSVTQISGDWGYTPDYKGWVSLVYAVKTETAVVTAAPVYAETAKTNDIKETPPNIKATGMKLSKPAAIINVGSSITLTAEVQPSNATDKNVTWSSSNPSVVSVDQNGKITGIKIGIASVTVSSADGSYKKSCIVTVLPGKLPNKK